MKNPDRFEERFNVVPVFDTVKQKRRSLARHLANDQKFMDKHGFILLEKPEPPPMEDSDIYKQIEDAGGEFVPGVYVEKKKRGRPKKQK